MVRNSEKYEQALHFRKRGFTYSEIAKVVGVSKGTVSNWFAKKRFSQKITKDNAVRAARDNRKRIALLNKARNAERTARYREAVRAAETEYRHYKHMPLFVAGLMLYRAAGDTKDSSRIRVTTNDSHLHRIFIHFAVDFLGVSKQDVHFWLLLPKGAKEASMRTQWARTVKLPLEQFGKTQFIGTKSSAQTLHNGTGNTIIGSTVLKKKLLRWIDLASKELQ